tara:strand:- start:200 stop:613 length:414 start_codon:yes stop_codon:yes gene_type:complete
MNNFSTLYPALLFPAIPLMMISFGNRYTSLATLIRKIHDKLITTKSSEIVIDHYFDQIKILTRRLTLVRSVQTLSGISFLFNLLTIFTNYINIEVLALNLFGLSVLIFSIAIIFFIYEIQLSTKALSKHLEDLKDFK